MKTNPNEMSIHISQFQNNILVGNILVEYAAGPSRFVIYNPTTALEFFNDHMKKDFKYIIAAFLDKNNQVITWKNFGEKCGKEEMDIILTSSLAVNASSVVICQNTGKLSDVDEMLTGDLTRRLETSGIRLKDRIIISGNETQFTAFDRENYLLVCGWQ